MTNSEVSRTVMRVAVTSSQRCGGRSLPSAYCYYCSDIITRSVVGFKQRLFHSAR